LAVALFFKFSRLLSVRNWDVLTLFLLVPGLLLLRQAKTEADNPPTEGDRVAAQNAPAAEANGDRSKDHLLWLAYLWLLCGSAYFFFRCLLDLTLVRRPALSPNLNLGGLAWLAGALFVCLVAVAVRQRVPPPDTADEEAPPTLRKVQQGAEKLVDERTGSGAETRFIVGTTLALVCHASLVAALMIIGWRHFQDLHAGMAAGTFYLLLPYTALQIGEWQSVWPTMLMLWAVAAYRWPTVAGLMIGLAAGSGYYPVVTFPIWLSFYWGRGAGRFAVSFFLAVSFCLATLGVILWIDGELAQNIKTALEHSDWQPWKKPFAEGFWKGVHWAYRLPVFIAYAAFMLTTFFWPRPKNLAHLLALSASVLIGIQFWFANKGGAYILWYLPLLLLLVFRPNLSERIPPAVTPEADWVRRLGQRLLRMGKRLLSVPEPVAQVH
jgi:hypothetical protein